MGSGLKKKGLMIILIWVFGLGPIRCPDSLNKIRDKHGSDVEPY